MKKYHIQRRYARMYELESALVWMTTPKLRGCAAVLAGFRSRRFLVRPLEIQIADRGREEAA